MFLGKDEQSAKEKALADLLEKIDGMESGKMKGKPVVAEMDVKSIDPKEAGLDEENSGKPEEALLGADKSAEEASEPTEEELAMIKELYHRYFG